ncbi:MAG: hypothetical protein KF889_16190 [Alphaproteobacteria bacterium]|nr:hypothetical protein [Alphaproteobacteria bacterium]MCW5740092.1 hypothetical protein [Alphaproteobacteria bacterium]
MRPGRIFSLGPASPDAARSPLLAGGDVVGEVEGRRIEAQFTDGRYHLLFVTWDSPYEEELTIVLLDERLRERDRRRLGGPWQPGILSDLACREDSIRFRFPHAQVHEVSVRSTLKGPRLKLRSES